MWAYGVTLWELYSNGRVPYSSLSNADILPYLTEGKRLETPTGLKLRKVMYIETPKEISVLMGQCWVLDASKRPNFKEICGALQGDEKEESEFKMGKKGHEYSASPPVAEESSNYGVSPV